MAVGVAAAVPQIISNHRRRDVGRLSILAAVGPLTGSLTKIVTVWGDLLYVTTYLSKVVLYSVMLTQFLVYEKISFVPSTQSARP